MRVREVSAESGLRIRLQLIILLDVPDTIVIQGPCQKLVNSLSSGTSNRILKLINLQFSKPNHKAKEDNH